jgi:hypothetical protein
MQKLMEAAQMGFLGLPLVFKTAGLPQELLTSETDVIS